MVKKYFFLAVCLITSGLFFHPQRVLGETSSSLLFSEYLEGSSYNKALEIYNPTNNPINLINYQVKKYVNGNSYSDLIAQLPDFTLDSKEVYVLCHPSADSAIISVCDLQTGNLSVNGNDAVVLINNELVVDSIGQAGFDPGTEWGSGLVSTADNTLVRKCSIILGDSNTGDVFDPSLEWDGYPVNTFSYLGSHQLCLPTSTPTPSIEPTTSPTVIVTPIITIIPTATLNPTIMPTITPSPIPCGNCQKTIYLRIKSVLDYLNCRLSIFKR